MGVPNPHDFSSLLPSKGFTSKCVSNRRPDLQLKNFGRIKTVQSRASHLNTSNLMTCEEMLPYIVVCMWNAPRFRWVSAWSRAGGVREVVVLWPVWLQGWALKVTATSGFGLSPCFLARGKHHRQLWFPQTFPTAMHSVPETTGK